MRKLFPIVVLIGLALCAGSAFAAGSACTICTSTTYNLGWLGQWSFDTDCQEVSSCSDPF
ncbi:hypothetical protein [Xanthomonas albilineans]|uniref:hypothetical protein n=1 Tax=Xanthomonas albilineans TaxID=29447 RepID=UPI0011B05962|nr:hypothetical protein [Xanthomonas albilineans]